MKIQSLPKNNREAGIFSGEFWSLPDGRYILGARAIERRDFHRYDGRVAVKLGAGNSGRHTICHYYLGGSYKEGG